MEIRLDKNGNVIREDSNTYQKLQFALKQLDAEIKRRYGNASQEELDFLKENPTINIEELGLDSYGKS